MRTLTLLLLLAGPAATPVKAQVQNPGFENGISGWNVYCPCQPYLFTGDVPPGGGSQSLSVGILDFNCVCSIVETIYQPASWLTPGTWVLSAWIRNADPGNAPGAAVRLSEGPAYASPILADAWSDDGVWTYVADTFLVTSSTNISALQLSLIPDDGNQMPLGLFAAFDQVLIQPLIATSMEEHAAVALSVFPMPVSDVLTIALPEPWSSLTVLDAMGRVVQQVTPVRTEGPMRMMVAELPSGNYLLQATTDAGFRTVRFIKN
ncbi:MAG: T9SS type A sorting domain-containing protein [Flavobacteriales bacterium]|jgi:hypothetical protein|nr:T9SS type A sorting domain-containing protein [Flavobacteriales bacterium]MBK7941940.1 T9SS type A sorting domain-containing protein [Flavobacteriales bacterium]MBK9700483.1 T9SS type A sorting domain-containing protein [Flavobacteriales bacterium]